MKSKKVDLSRLSPEQRDAFTQFYRDAHAVGPQYEEVIATSRQVFAQWLKSPQWHASEGRKPDQAPSQTWSGAPEINYVDKFEGQP